MEQVKKILVGIDHVIHKIILLLAELSLVGMISIVCMTVFYRYVLNSGIVWAEEVPRILVSIFAFLACAMGCRDGFHVSVGIIYNRFPENGKVRKVLEYLTYFIILGVGIFMLYYGNNLVVKLSRSRMPATGWPRSVQYISMVVGGAVIIYDAILYIFGILSPDDLMYSEKEKVYKAKHLKDFEKEDAQ